MQLSDLKLLYESRTKVYRSEFMSNTDIVKMNVLTDQLLDELGLKVIFNDLYGVKLTEYIRNEIIKKELEELVDKKG